MSEGSGQVRRVLGHLWQSRVWLFSLAAFLILCTIVTTAESFRGCIQQPQQPAPYDPIYESVALLNIPLGRLKPCVGVFLGENGEAITALFTVVLAFSTILLWQQTKRLAEGAERQAEDMKKSIAATRDVASATQALASAADDQASAMTQAAGAAEASADAARAANRLSVEISNAERRPIISVELETKKDLVWADGAAKTRLRIILKNHGKTPARIVRHDLIIVPATGLPPYRNLESEVNKLLGMNAITIIAAKDSLATVYLDSPWDYLQDIEVKPAEIAGATQIAINVLGCIWYESVGGGRIYQAAFSWSLGQVLEHKIVTNRFQIGENIPREVLIGRRHLSDNFDRDVPEGDIYRQ